MVLTEYSLGGLIYISLKEILKVRPYAKGIKTVNDLITIKEYKDIIIGKVTKGQLIQVEDNNTGRQPKFVNKNEILSLFDTDSDDVKILEQAPPILCADDLVFFKDDDGVEYNVLMRGEREKDKIFFKLKDVEKVFQMDRLNEIVQDATTIYTEHIHYKWFKVDANETIVEAITIGKRRRPKELYLTYVGLKHLIECARSGIVYKFKSWFDDISFVYAYGSINQKIESFANSVDIDSKSLKAILSKTDSKLNSVYLINIKKVDNNGKSIYKYGFTKHLYKRLSQHKTSYGHDIELVYWTLIAEAHLKKAEDKIKDYSKDYAYKEWAGKQELIALSSEELDIIISYYKTVGNIFQSKMDELANHYEKEIKDAKHETELMRKDLQAKDKELEAKDKELEAKGKELEAKDKELLDKDQQIKWMQQIIDNLSTK